MENRKQIVWVIGANAAGKSTLAANTQKMFRRRKKANSYYESVTFSFTQTSDRTANLGKFNHPVLVADGERSSACCGVDTLPKKELVRESLKQALKSREFDIVFVEGVMATRQWIEFINEGVADVLLVLVDLPLEHCINRLLERRAAKTGRSAQDLLAELSERTVKNVSGKLTGFRNMFRDLKDIPGIYPILFDSSKYSAQELAERLYFTITRE